MTRVTLQTEADVARALKKLLAIDPRLVPVAEVAGRLPHRRRPGGFEGLAAVIMGQQISILAAEAIWLRLKAAVDPFTPQQLARTPEASLRAAGLSAAKISTLLGIADAEAGGFDLLALHDLPAEEAVRAMTALKGIGRWTAESYLLFCVGNPDVFPAGDLALQAAAHQGLGLRQRPDEKRLRALAADWAPWRGVAARLFWAYYRKHREAQKEAAALAGKSSGLAAKRKPPRAAGRSAT